MKSLCVFLALLISPFSFAYAAFGCAGAAGACRAAQFHNGTNTPAVLQPAQSQNVINTPHTVGSGESADWGNQYGPCNSGDHGQKQGQVGYHFGDLACDFFVTMVCDNGNFSITNPVAACELPLNATQEFPNNPIPLWNITNGQKK